MFWTRFLAVFIKEFVQMRRDRITFAMMVGVPLMQLVLFGYAINSDPKSLPTAIVMADYVAVRTLDRDARPQTVRLLQRRPRRQSRGRGRRTAASAATCSLSSPSRSDFSRDLVRGDRPTLLVEADATDPAATSNAAPH